MTATPQQLVALAALGSAALLVGAFIFQALGYAPCQMCYWQRWPHGMAIAFAAVALYDTAWVWILGGAVSAAATSGLGMFHVGVEQKWWAGPASCSGDGAGLGNLSGNDLLSVDVLDKVVMCDEVSWAFLGISMPGWNALFSAVLVGLWGLAFLRHVSAGRTA